MTENQEREIAEMIGISYSEFKTYNPTVEHGAGFIEIIFPDETDQKFLDSIKGIRGNTLKVWSDRESGDDNAGSDGGDQ